MTIHRLHYKNGVIFEGVDLSHFVETLFVRDEDTVQILPAGEYLLTPEAIKNPKYDYSLLVGENGEGVMQMIPRTAEAVSEIMSPDGMTIDIKHGGRVMSLPHDMGIGLVGIPESEERIRIYEIITHTPGRSPERG